MVAYREGRMLFEGKTKIGYELIGHPHLVLLKAKDDITAGDGAKHDIIDGKGKLATRTTCNVFRFLSSRGIPTAFYAQPGANSFVAVKCDMLKYEVVVRAEAHGSYLKRFPSFRKGQVFDEPVVEFFLKSSGKKWNGMAIPVDDPLILMKNGDSLLYRPDLPLDQQQPIHVVDGYPPRHEEMAQIATATFKLLAEAWTKQNARLVDFKVEFGITPDNQLLLADVIDNDSWRVVQNNEYIDKQIYRDGGDLDEVLVKYRRVADQTTAFLRE